MPGFDDLLTRELERAARPADPAGVFERVDRRRARRHAMRRVQTAALAVVVLAGTAGGIAVLNRAFREAPPGPADIPDVRNGVLVVVRQEGGRSHLWVVEPSEPAGPRPARQLTTGPFEDVNPAISPDGRTVAFVRFETPNEAPRIWLIGIDGSDERRFTDRSMSPSTTPIDPAWSPDGTRLAYAGATMTGQRIFVASLDGSSVALASPSGTDASDPSWSPDGTRLVYSAAEASADQEPRNFDLFVTDLQTGESAKLTNTPGAAEVFPSWSPDGELIAYVRTPSILDDTPRGGIAVIAPDGSGERFLVDDGTIVGDPTWSPDGTLVAFTREDADGQAIFAIRPDGSGLRRLASGREAAWQPLVAGGTVAPEPSPIVGGPAAPQEFEPERISGVAFPVCNATKVDGTFLGPDSRDAAFVFGRRGDVGGCQAPGEGFVFIGLGTPEGELSVVSGPIDCLGWCRVFAAPDLDGDGTQELAIVTVTGASTLHVSLFRMGGIDGPDAGPLSWVPIEVAPPGDPKAGFAPGPVLFPLYGSVTHIERLGCVDDAGTRRIVATVAERGFADPTRYHVREAVFEYGSGALHVVSTHRYPVDEEALASEGLEMGPDLCGAPTIGS